jgi:formylglycine-generating enzyme
MRDLTVLALISLLLAAPAAAADKQPTAPEVDLDAMVPFDAGTFAMGVELQTPAAYGDSWFIDQTPAREVDLGSFRLDRYEVTVEQFALFLTYAAGEYHYHPDQPIERLHEGYAPIAGSGDLPATYVTWEAAHHYCLWAGKRLPTEAEWERAAAGTEARTHPWGDDGPNCSRANYYTSATYCEDGPVVGGARPDGDSPDGVADLGGNVAEWVTDWYGEYDPDDLDDPTGPDHGDLRVVRGGSFLEWSQALRTHTRRGADPGARSPALGFRCAWSDEASDGALRGDLSPPDEIEREPTDRPLADPVDAPDVLADDLGQPTEIVRLDGDWYVLDEAEAAVLRITDDPLAPEALLTGLDTPVDLVSDGSALFVADSGAGEVLRVFTDGSFDVLASGQDAPTHLVAGDGEVFWARSDAIVRHDDQTGVEVLAEVEEVSHLALSDVWLYYTCTAGLEGGDEFGRLPRAGGDAEILLGAPSPGYDFDGVAVDADDSPIYVLQQKASWPSNVEICAYYEATGDHDCFAHAPPKASAPTLVDGELVLTSQYTLLRATPADGDLYEEIGTWSNAKAFGVTDGEVIWTDASDGRVYREAE